MSLPFAKAVDLEVPEATVEKQEPPPTRSFSSNTAKVLGAQMARTVFSGLLEVIYARILGPFGRGQMSLCAMVDAFYLLGGGLGGEIPLVLWSADHRKKPAEWMPAVLLCGLVGTVLAEICWVVVYFYWHPVFLKGITNTLAILLAITFPLNILVSYVLSLSLGLDRIRERSILVVSHQVVTCLVAGVLLTLVSPTAEMAMTALVVGVLVVVCIALVFLRDYLKTVRGWTIDFATVRRALSLGLRGQMGNVATFLNYRLDVFVVNYYLSTKEVGLYSLGVLLSEVIWQVPNAAAAATLSRTARNVEKGSPEFTCLVCRQVLLLSCVTAVVLAVLSTLLVPVVFGARFRPSVPVIWWILPGTVAFAVGKIMSADLLGRGWPQYSASFAVVTLFLTTALDFLLVPRMGINGAAIASSIAYFFNAVLIAWVLRRKLSVSWKSMFVPSLLELGMYRQMWNRFLNWFYPSTVQ